MAMDIRDPVLIEVLEGFRPEAMNHQAAQIDVAAAVADPAADASINLLGTLNVLQAAVRAGACRIIVGSTIAVDGERRRVTSCPRRQGGRASRATVRRR